MKAIPIELQRLYANESKTGPFVIRAKALPAEVTKDWTDEQHIARREAERAAIDAEWMYIWSLA